MAVLGVVTVGGVAVDRALVEGHHGQALSLEPAQDLPDQAAPDSIGLDQHQRSLSHGRQG